MTQKEYNNKRMILPNDVVNIILTFDGRIKYRKGEYVDQIYTMDQKYNKVRQHLIHKSCVIQTVTTYKYDGVGCYSYITVPINDMYTFHYWIAFTYVFYVNKNVRRWFCLSPICGGQKTVCYYEVSL